MRERRRDSSEITRSEDDAGGFVALLAETENGKQCQVSLFVPRPSLDEKSLKEQKRRRSTRQRPGTKSGRRSADKSRINRLQNAGQSRVLFVHRFT